MMKDDADIMKTYKRILTVLLLVAALALLAGCSREPTPYETNNSENYTLSVQYDANGGLFTTNTSIITDSYAPGALKADGNGQAEIALIAPDDSRRGNDAFAPVKSGYFLAGWYATRTEAEDGSYTYSDPWNFETKRLTVDTGKTYSADKPVLTLYAAWVPEFTVDFYDMESGQLLDTYAFNPTLQGTTLQIPAWDAKTGAMEMYKFPARDGYTFAGVYDALDAAEPIRETAITHKGEVDLSTGTAKDGKMTLYVKWTEGEWFRISTVEQFRKNARLDGNYILEADLDFTDAIWPTALMYGNFTGTIQGNGHTIRNVNLTQTDNAKLNAGLFGQLTERATLSDVTFEQITFTVKKGARMAGTTYGILAGSISDEAALSGVKLQKSALQIDSAAHFMTEDYSIGLLCGIGATNRVATADLTCVATGSAPEKVAITVNGNEVSLEFAD